MKKIFTLFAAVLLTANVLAQAPQTMSYQAVIRNSSNALVANASVGMQISILQTTSTGTAVYEETHTPTTDANGLVSLAIGSGTVVSGTFSAIDWSAGPYFIKTETDPAGGTSYSITGISQLMSVPFALYAANSGSAGVPYTGATAAVNLGAHNLTVNALTSTNGLTVGAVTYPYADGTSGQVLSTNGSGAVSWSTPVSVSVGSIDSSSNTNGGTITSGVLSLAPANATNGGIVTSGDQNFAGNKTLSGTFGVGTNATEVSAALEVKSTTQGLLPPRMTSVQRDNISSPVAGLIIWCSTCGSHGEVEVYNGTTWTNIVGGDRALSIGDRYQGGIIAYFFQSGDPGYIASSNTQHGLIAATADQSSGILWTTGSLITTGASGTAIGTGLSNTNAIITAQGTNDGPYAASVCRNYNGGSYTDWYLPSFDELNKLYLNKEVIGGFSGNTYWSSTEFSGSSWNGAIYIRFSDGYTSDTWKNAYWALNPVRAIRSF